MTDFFSTIGEFDHLAVTAGESLDLGKFAAVDLEKARRCFEVRFWGTVTAAKYAAKRIKSTGSIILTNGISSGCDRKKDARTLQYRSHDRRRWRTHSCLRFYRFVLVLVADLVLEGYQALFSLRWRA